MPHKSSSFLYPLIMFYTLFIQFVMKSFSTSFFSLSFNYAPCTHSFPLHSNYAPWTSLLTYKKLKWPMEIALFSNRAQHSEHLLRIKMIYFHGENNYLAMSAATFWKVQYMYYLKITDWKTYFDPTISVSFLCITVPWPLWNPVWHLYKFLTDFV